MKTKPVKDFEQFKKWFTEYQNRFGLTGYQVYFKYEPLQDAFAEIEVHQEGMVATVSLNSKLPDQDKPFQNVKASAQHEAIHLITARMRDLAKRRYVSPDEIYEADEELVRRIAKLISD